ncbi:hypothetical protein [Streptomyces sp. NPDC006668]|uniref:hypothetical protein n=1 Tax=Streptomyces sp. NPDC006668 TaxID=3156903 RepID=UPI0033F771F2
MKKSKIAAIFAALSLSLGIAAVSTDNANAAQGDQHFILVSTHGAPRWHAAAQHFDQDGTQIGDWRQHETSGGRVKWDFTSTSNGNGYVDVTVEGVSELDLTHLRDDRDHCFLVTAGGEPRYTGDSQTGGCNAR